MSCHAMSRRAMSRHAMSRHAITCAESGVGTCCLLKAVADGCDATL